MRCGCENTAYLFGENKGGQLPFSFIGVSTYQSLCTFQEPSAACVQLKQQIKRLKYSIRNNFPTIIRGFKDLGVFQKQS